MPWGTTSSVVSGSPTNGNNKRNVGVLEVKMKQRLQLDQDAVAIGSIHHAPHHSHSTSKLTSDANHSSSPQKKKARKVHKLPQLQAAARASEERPISFENERAQVMDALALPSPTRQLIQKHVDHAKHDHAAHQDALPPIAGAFRKRDASRSFFPQAYQRGELPIMVESKAGGKTLKWTQDVKTLDYATVLPLFLDGMRETSYPFNFMAREGAFQLLQFGRHFPERVLSCLPKVVPALRAILDLRDEPHMRDALQLIQQLTYVQGIGQALVPYYRQLLPLLNMFKAKRRNLGDSMDFKQHSAKDLSEMILETLELLEKTGGPDAYVNIKYMVPTYEGAQPQK